MTSIETMDADVNPPPHLILDEATIDRIVASWRAYPRQIDFQTGLSIALDSIRFLLTKANEPPKPRNISTLAWAKLKERMQLNGYFTKSERLRLIAYIEKLQTHGRYPVSELVDAWARVRKQAEERFAQP